MGETFSSLKRKLKDTLRPVEAPPIFRKLLECKLKLLRQALFIARHMGWVIPHTKRRKNKIH